MNTKPSFGRRQTAAARREQLLTQFERSGLSAAEFARQHGLNYTTFCGWRKRWEGAKALPSFVQVEVTPSAGAAELVIEAGQVRIRINHPTQMELAVALIKSLDKSRPC